MLRVPASSNGISGLSAHRHGWRAAMGCVAAACLMVAGCERVTPSSPPAPQAAAASAPDAPAAVPVAYTAPSADALYQMVAPIALYPDKLVAQVLAGATYPDQISAAESWLGQNPGLKGAALAGAADAQPWDPSVKSLTAFPNVLEQMASNLPWTTALGKAYYRDPSDVMNAIQAMRARAARQGTLKSSDRLRVATVPAAALPPLPPPAQAPVSVYAGPAVVPAPATVITIEPAQAQTVYVPRYDPAVVYGTPVPVYPSYRWAAPAPVAVAAGPDPVAVGALAFGAGVLVAAVASHHHAWGWDAWDVHWGAPSLPPAAVAWGPAPPPPPAWRPAVVYRGNTYVSNSTTVIENVHRTTVNNRNVYVNAAAQLPGLPAPAAAAAAVLPARGPGGGPVAPSPAAIATPSPDTARQALHPQPMATALRAGSGEAVRPAPGVHGSGRPGPVLASVPAGDPVAVQHAHAGPGQGMLRAGMPGVTTTAPGMPGARPAPATAVLQEGPAGRHDGGGRDAHLAAAQEGHAAVTSPATAARAEPPTALMGQRPAAAAPVHQERVNVQAPRGAALELPTAHTSQPPQPPAALRVAPQPQRPTPPPAAMQPPVHAEPRHLSVAAMHAPQQAAPHVPSHPAAMQPRPAAPPQQAQAPHAHSTQQHGPERERRPHGEHGG